MHALSRSPAAARPSSRSLAAQGWTPGSRADRRPAERRRAERGLAAQARGVGAESAAVAALAADGWTVLGRRLRTPAGEIDLVAQRDNLISFIEVKSRPSLADAAAALTPRQRRRLIDAAEILLAAQPQWQEAASRFDVLLVDAKGQTRRIADAFRIGDDIT